MASATVGSPRWSCHLVVGSWLVMTVLGREHREGLFMVTDLVQKTVAICLLSLTACAVQHAARAAPILSKEPAVDLARTCREFASTGDRGECSVTVCADDYGCTMRGSDTTWRLESLSDGGRFRRETVFLNIDDDLPLGTSAKACGEAFRCPVLVGTGDAGPTAYEGLPR